MLIGMIVGIVTAVGGLIGYMIWSCRRAEEQKYYDAAYKILKENCLDRAISCENIKQDTGKKLMVYLKWKEKGSRGFVFNPEKGVRIGRAPEENDICIREASVSAKHCVLYLTGGQLAIQDLQSANGTWIRRGIWKHLVKNAEFLCSGDRVMVGSLKIKVTIFLFDLALI